MRWIFFVFCLILIAAPMQTEATSLKAGGGFLFDPARWGGHVSVEIPLGDSYPTYLAPYVEWYRKSRINEIPVGLALLYKAPLSDLFGTVFFGVGGGVFLGRGPTVTDPFTGQSFKISVTEAMISAGGGVRMDMNDRIGFYVQARWFRAFATGAEHEVSLNAGLHFEIGEKD